MISPSRSSVRRSPIEQPGLAHAMPLVHGEGAPDHHGFHRRLGSTTTPIDCKRDDEAVLKAGCRVVIFLRVGLALPVSAPFPRLACAYPPAYHRGSMKRPYRVVVAKPGLDGHDRGPRSSPGPCATPGSRSSTPACTRRPSRSSGRGPGGRRRRRAVAAVGRPPDCPPGDRGLAARGRDDVVVLVGGIIPDADIPQLKAAGVAEVFTPGAPLPSIGHGWPRRSTARGGLGV